MSYFNTYLKRVNRYGNTLQERIQGKKEHDFLTFMRKSPNLVRAHNEGDLEKYYDAVLQTKEYDEDEVVNYLLVPLENQISLGSIIHTQADRYKQPDGSYIEKHWINYAIDPYTNSGYNRYTIVELEAELFWVVNGIKYSSLCHATGGGSGARDKNINLKFRTQFSEAGVYLPNKRYSIVMPANEHIKKNMIVTLGGEIWRVAGFDNISVQGVSYITLEEYLKDKIDDEPISNSSQLKNWYITTSLGSNLQLSNASQSKFELIFYYNGEKQEKVNFSILPNENYEILTIENEISLTPLNSSSFNTALKIVLEGWSENEAFEIPISFTARPAIPLVIVGPEVLAMGEEKDYFFSNIDDNEFETIIFDGNCAEIQSRNIKDKKISLKGLSIGKGKFILQDSPDNTIIEYPVEVQSIWLGGKSNVN